MNLKPIKKISSDMTIYTIILQQVLSKDQLVYLDQKITKIVFDQ